MEKALVIDVGKCTGCRQCELACSYEHTGEFNPARSRITVFDFHEKARFVPYTCTQCDQAWCMQVCPVGAITNEVKCDLCGGDPACARACPTEAIVFTDVSVQGFEKMRAWAEKTDTAPQATA